MLLLLIPALALAADPGTKGDVQILKSSTAESAAIRRAVESTNKQLPNLRAVLSSELESMECGLSSDLKKKLFKKASDAGEIAWVPNDLVDAFRKDVLDRSTVMSGEANINRYLAYYYLDAEPRFIKDSEVFRGAPLLTRFADPQSPILSYTTDCTSVVGASLDGSVSFGPGEMEGAVKAAMNSRKTLAFFLAYYQNPIAMAVENDSSMEAREQIDVLVGLLKSAVAAGGKRDSKVQVRGSEPVLAIARSVTGSYLGAAQISGEAGGGLSFAKISGSANGSISLTKQLEFTDPKTYILAAPSDDAFHDPNSDDEPWTLAQIADRLGERLRAVNQRHVNESSSTEQRVQLDLPANACKLSWIPVVEGVDGAGSVQSSYTSPTCTLVYTPSDGAWDRFDEWDEQKKQRKFSFNAKIGDLQVSIPIAW